jgi:hypothetical protein
MKMKGRITLTAIIFAWMLLARILAMAPASSKHQIETTNGTVTPTAWVYLPYISKDFSLEPAPTSTDTPTIPTHTPTATPTSTPTLTPTPTPTDAGRDLDEIVRAIPILGSERRDQWDPSCNPTFPHEHCLVYYESQALLDHGFGGSWQTTRYFRYTPSHYYLTGYYAFSEDVEPAMSPHSFAYDVANIEHSQYRVVSYTGIFTSTLYDSFTYSITIFSSPYLENVTVTKDYGSGETYQIELDVDRVSYEPAVLSYIATVYGGGYSGATRAVNDVIRLFVLSITVP